MVGRVLQEPRDRVEPHRRVRPHIRESDVTIDRHDPTTFRPTDEVLLQRPLPRRCAGTIISGRDTTPRKSATRPEEVPEKGGRRVPPAPIRRASGRDDGLARAPRRVGAGASPVSPSRCATVTAIRRSTRSVSSKPSCSVSACATSASTRSTSRRYSARIRPRRRSPAISALDVIEDADLREVFLGEWEGGELRARAAAGDPIFRRIWERGTVGRHPGR